MVFHIANVLWQGWLLYNLLKGVRDNITTNELLNGHKYSYLRHPITGQWNNPFDKGAYLNIMDLLAPSIDYFHLYQLPRSVNTYA